MIKLEITNEIEPIEERPTNLYVIEIEYMYGDADHYETQEAYFKHEEVAKEFLRYIDLCMMGDHYDYEGYDYKLGYLDAIWNAEYDWDVFNHTDKSEWDGLNFKYIKKHYKVDEEDIPEIYKTQEFIEDIENIGCETTAEASFIEGVGGGKPEEITAKYYDEVGNIHKVNLFGLKSQVHCCECTKYKTKKCNCGEAPDRDPLTTCYWGELKED